MLNSAVLVNDDFIVCSHSKHIYEGDLSLECNAVMMLFVKMKKTEMQGGTLYADGCVGLNEAAMIVAAKINKVILTRMPVMSDEMCAIEILKENNISVIYNSNNIL